MDKIDIISENQILKNGMSITQKLGQGQFSNVYQAVDQNNDQYALQFYNQSPISQKDRENQGKMLSKLSHQNILHILHNEEDFAVLPIMENGQLFSYVGKFPELEKEKIARFYFKQMVSAVSYLFQNQIVNRDLKLENMLLDQQFGLKICDFGFATEFSDLSDEMSSVVGTENYMAPEVMSAKKYSGQKADIFSLGVVLFSLFSGFPPYAKCASKHDPYYKFFIEKRSHVYWNALQKQFNLKYSDEFIDLIDKTMEPNPDERIDIEGLLNHKWLAGPVSTKEEIIEIMSKIKESLPTTSL